MKRKIGCLHAHYSNIDYIQDSIASNEVELVHFVDPGLMNRISTDSSFADEQAQNKVIEQVEWISQANVDAILITCTNYIAFLDETRLKTSIPIIKMDEPFFQYVCSINEPQALIFTNPATVQGTMRRLNEFATSRGQLLSKVEAHVIKHTFELIMESKKEQYIEEVSKYIKELLSSEKQMKISVAQLSMVEAAVKVGRELDVEIGNPLDSLVTHLAVH